MTSSIKSVLAFRARARASASAGTRGRARGCCGYIITSTSSKLGKGSKSIRSRVHVFTVVGYCSASRVDIANLINDIGELM